MDKLTALWTRIAPYKWVIGLLIAFLVTLYFAFKERKAQLQPDPTLPIAVPKSDTVTTHDTTQNAIDAFKLDAKSYE